MSARTSRARRTAAVLLLAATAVGCGDDAAGRTSATSTTGGPDAPRGARAWRDATAGPSGSANNGVEPATGPATLRLRWRLDGTGALFGPPVLDGDVAYVSSNQGARAVDVRSGEVRWTRPDVTTFAGLTLADGGLYGVSGDATEVVRLDPDDGAVRWRAPLPAQDGAATFAAPRVVGDTVLVGESSTESFTAADGLDFRGRLHALDAATGAVRWQFWTTEPPHAGASVWTFPTVSADGATVFFGTSNNYRDPASDSSDSVFAVDVATGERRWSRQLLADDVWALQTHGARGEFDYDVSTSPLLVSGRGPDGTDVAVVGQKNGIVTALSTTDGTLRWQRQVSDGGRQGGVLGNLADDGTHLLVVGNNGTAPGPEAEPANGEEVVPRTFWPDDAVPTAVLSALDPADGSVVWRRQLGAWSLAGVTVVDGRGLVPVGRGLELFDVADGHRLDRVELPAETSSVAVGGGGLVLVGVSAGWNGNGNSLLAYDVVDGPA